MYTTQQVWGQVYTDETIATIKVRNISTTSESFLLCPLFTFNVHGKNLLT